MKRRDIVVFSALAILVLTVTGYRMRFPQSAAAAPAQATQSADQQQQPLQVRGSITHSPDGTPQLSYTLVNAGTKRITAYTLIFEFLDRNGKLTGRGTQNNVWELDSNARRKGLEPGESWISAKPAFLPVHRDDGSPVTYRISVDYVLFDDHSNWGADTLKQSYQIAGLQQGFAVARQQLKTMLEKEGAEAVLETLRQGVPPNYR